jgi:hypothetical protein
LIKTKGKSKFPRDEHDWVWLNNNVLKRLKEVYNEG